MRHLRSDRGAATLWSLALTFMLLLSGAVAMATGQIAVARQQASVAMDLAALAPRYLHHQGKCGTGCKTPLAAVEARRAAS